jgi:molybdopterin-containing oxidoreductase family iron-sulfur binding subunit
VDVLIVHNANPEHVKHRWLEARIAEHEIAKSALVVYLGTMLDETAELADWVLPIDSPLESWGDCEPYAGLTGMVQPAMSRIYDSRAAGDVFLALAEEAGKPLTRPGASRPLADARQWLRQRMEEIGRRVAPARGAEEFWQDSLRQGAVVEQAAASSSQPSVELSADLPAEHPPYPLEDLTQVTKTQIPGFWDFLRKEYRSDAKYLALWTWPSPMLFDGRAGNRSWLQEAPDPVSTIQWGSWIDIHPKTAGTLGLSTGDLVELVSNPDDSSPPAIVTAPIRITEDVAEGTVAIPFGQGHSAMGRNAAGRGARSFDLSCDSPDKDPFGLVNLRPTGRKAAITFATATQEQHGREIIQWVKLSKLRGMKEAGGEHFSLPLPEGYDPAKDTAQPRRYTAHRWAMVIDLDRCIGCGACAVACQAENNVAVVGPVEAAKGRIMNWLRIVPYRHPEDPRRVGFLPMLCQHCDSAPCEPVCPVFASVHSEEGLNAQVYNRCIGTRYCSNNCPYKVRRFNWLDHSWPTPLDWQLNPDVTVRERGVMEKCTFCVQRIRRAKQRARREGRAVRDGEVQPACGQSCPTKAIVFGDLLDADSQVSRLTRTDPRRYHVLEELNTKPAVTYLKRIENDE